MNVFGRSPLLVLLVWQVCIVGSKARECRILENCVALSPVSKLKDHLPSTEDELKSICPLEPIVGLPDGSFRVYFQSRHKCEGLPVECPPQRHSSLISTYKYIPTEPAVGSFQVRRQALQYARCLLGEIRSCTEHDLFERTASENETIASTSALLEDFKEVVTDTCNENSTLYQGYLSHVDCFSAYMNRSDLQQHRYNGLVVYDAYRQSREQLGEPRDPNERQCMSTAYAVGAFSTGLRKNCGPEANDTFLEVFRRLKKLLREFNKCSNVKVAVLRTKFMAFLDYLGLEQRQIRMFSAVFRVMR